MPVLPPNAIQGADADAAQVANVIDPQALGAENALPPPVSAIPPLPVDALAAAASVPPPAFPDNPVDAAVAPLLPPAGGPALSLVPPSPPEAPPGTPSEQAARNVAKAEEIGAEGVANATEKAGLDQQKADEEAKVAAEREKRLGELVARQEVHRQAAEARTADARAKAEAEPFHTFFESRSNAQNAATAIGLILGGISWNANHVNRGVDLLERMQANELQLQKEKHADLWRAVESAEKGETTLDASQLRETARFNAVEAARHDAMAARLNAAIAMNRGKGDITTAKKVALAESEKANQFWELSAKADAAANHQKELDAETARHHQEQEKTAALRASKYKTNGGGAGGSGSGSRLEAAAIELQDKIAEAKAAGKPLDQRAIDKEAVRLKIPLIGKPNTINARTIAADAAKEAAAEKKDLTISDKAENTIVRDGKGNALGRAGSAKIAASQTEKYIQRSDAADRMEELADDIKVHGAKIDPSDSKAVQRRVAKFANAIIGIGIVSPLGKTNETLHLETKALGIPGVIDWDHLSEGIKNYVLTAGANEENVRAKVAETRKNRDAFARSITPLSDEEKKKYSNTGGASAEFPPKVLDGVRYTYDPAKGKYVKDVVKL